MANTYPTTQFPLGSTEVKVLFNNASNFDEAMNSELPSFYDRFNKRRETWAGMQKMVADFIEAFGWEATHLTYVDGTPLTVLRPTQLIDRAGSVYKVKMPASFPVNLTGTWATDQLLLVDVGDASLRMSLAATTGANLVGFDVTETYSPSTTGFQMVLANPKRVSAASFGIFPDTGTDMSVPVQAAIDAGAAIEIPEGTYLFSLGQTIQLEGGLTYAGLIYKTRACFYGAGKSRTIFKLMDNQSTDAMPLYHNLMAANTLLEYVHIEGITFDSNGQNNKISPNRGIGVYNGFNCAALMVSGSVATGGADARMVHSKILNCEFINCPGVTSIALGQRYNHSGVKGYDVEIAGNNFYNNGIDASDHSSIYCFTDYADIHDNFFDHPTASNGIQGPVVGWEMFGTGNKAHHNTVRNYCQMCWVGSGEEGVHAKFQVANNIAEVNYVGVAFWGVSPQDDGLADVIITDNIVHITASAITNPTMSSSTRCAIYAGLNAGTLLRGKFSGNIFYCTDRTNNCGVLITGNAGTSLDTVLITDNLISGFSLGVFGGAGGAGPLTNLVVKGNTIENMAVTTSIPLATRGVKVSGANFSIDISGNNISGGDILSVPHVGIELTGSCSGDLHISENQIKSTTDNIINALTVSSTSRRSGKQALQFNVLPTDGFWQIGDDAYVSPAGLNIGSGGGVGSPGSKYILTGWKRITTGSANVLNTDWFEQRILTGN
jgi:hypothetical protein